MAKKTKGADKNFVATIIDYGILEGHDPITVAEVFQDIKQQYKVGKFTILFNPQYETPETVRELSQTVSEKIGQDVPIIAYPDSGILSRTDLRNITFSVNRTHFAHRDQALVQMPTFYNDVYGEQFKEGGFDVCESNTIGNILENIGAHVEGLKTWKGLSLD